MRTLICFLILTQTFALAEGFPRITPPVDKIPTPPSDVVSTIVEMLPSIEAKTYSTPLIRISRSSKVLLLSDPSHSQPPPGKVLLLKKHTENIVGLRVLKNYPDKAQFAAKVVKNYLATGAVTRSNNYKVIEKVADLIPQVPTLTSQDQLDIDELEAPPETIQPDPQPEPEPEPTDEPTPEPTAEPERTPSPTEEVDDEEEQERADDELSSLVVEDVADLDPHNALLGFEFGFFAAGGPSGVTRYYAGAGLRLGLIMSQPVFFTSKNLQDSIAPEVGIYFFKVINYLAIGDAFDVFVASAVGRYSLHFGPNFGLFTYAGLTKNNVLSSANNTSQGAINNLSLYYLAAGGGFFFNIGPHWEARMDAGIDRMTFGLLLRF